MLTWINLLHLYQPPHQNGFIFGGVCDESYRRIIRLLNFHDQANFTLNITGSLLEQLQFYQKDDIIAGIKQAVESGRAELVGSAMFHPILPLLNQGEIKRQIELNNKISKKFLGAAYNPQGFFLPEMAYDSKTASVIKALGFKWIILDEISGNGKLNSLNCGQPYQIKSNGLKVIFRDRKISNSFVPETINELAKENSQKNKTIITATDGELYGHHHWDLERHLESVFSNRNIKTVKISDYLNNFSDFPKIEPVASCWESKEEDLRKSIPYRFWSDPNNKLHQFIWKLAKFSVKQVESHRQDESYKLARNLLDRGLTSCTFWSASGQKSFLWKETIWNPDMIENGILNLIRAIRSLKKIETKDRLRAEKMFLKIIKNVWQSHWEKYY